MKIIKNNNIKVCETCGCIFQYDKEDVKKVELKDDVIKSIYEPSGMKYVNCPRCKRQHFIYLKFKEGDKNWKR